MNFKNTNVGPLGLFGFAFTTFLLSAINAEWISSSSMGVVLALAVIFGGIVQLLVGFFEYPKGNTFGFVVFSTYGAFWISYVLLTHFFGDGVTAGGIGTYLILWAILSLTYFIGSLKGSKAVALVLIILTITFVLLAIGAWTGINGWNVTGGYFGLVTAVVAFYAGASSFIASCYKKEIA
ncbi:GPR1/FUN34/YaaH family transporter [Helicobacter sp. 11S02629-2]|uniref:acetate uptake transporter n=1 Tax=Helicobacter sp. 11S02629-2 TaxID=1476195 RepID=UPI000BA743E7|nr:GPR1/FUN34/YaaH family transporter [Helicobacter sp. 11S02629-2]PAF44337.1 hypothetical protein BKH40_05425 [Helicobacter sp. 11S02629-2]